MVEYSLQLKQYKNSFHFCASLEGWYYLEATGNLLFPVASYTNMTVFTVYIYEVMSTCAHIHVSCK